MKVVLRPIEDGDIEALCADPRPACVAEMTALGSTFEDALVESVRRSDWTGCATVDGAPVCLFGVAPGSVLSGLGVPWMLGGAGLDRAEVAFLRRSRPVADAMLATYPRLVNVVDAENRRTIRWLKWLGFRFDDAPVYVRGHPFHVFRLEK